MSNSVDPDETAHDEPSHLDLRCLQMPIIIAYGSERVKQKCIIESITCTSKFFNQLPPSNCLTPLFTFDVISV